MSNSTRTCGCFWIILAAMVASPLVVHAEEGHGENARTHLEQAIESGRKGDARGVGRHAQEAKRELIEENKEHPYTHLQKPIYGEHEKAEHDKEVFEEMDIAIEEAEEGDVEDATEAVERAARHLREKEQSK
ncbi:small metal-binding protein [Nitrosospira sp. Nsp2]|uniref:small metal-binding protein SmbP n=1 Tax=Nitrosospira sp. Nsp2 TaxID=136548 RepID=UPI000D300409|nr:small metal-binding protein SmbP [Nitrosospira sp. Nsp2]PTR16597.1 small metal-binding protein [Nitrosospira sp. Nsp2]